MGGVKWECLTLSTKCHRIARMNAFVSVESDVIYCGLYISEVPSLCFIARSKWAVPEIEQWIMSFLFRMQFLLHGDIVKGVLLNQTTSLRLGHIVHLFSLTGLYKEILLWAYYVTRRYSQIFKCTRISYISHVKRVLWVHLVIARQRTFK